MRMGAIQMTATKADNKQPQINKYNPVAKPPQRLSKEDRKLLLNLEPNTEFWERVSRLPKLKIIDGSTCGL
jgi:hypothetical protein